MCASAMRASAAPVLLRTTGLLVQPIRDAIPIDCSFGAMTARELKSCCLESSYIAHHRNFIWPCQQFLHAGGEVSRIQQSETLALVDGFFFGSADLLFSLEPVVDFRAGLIAATIQKVLVKLAVNLELKPEMTLKQAHEALRQLRKAPGITATAVITLVCCI